MVGSVVIIGSSSGGGGGGRSSSSKKKQQQQTRFLKTRVMFFIMITVMRAGGARCELHELGSCGIPYACEVQSDV